LYAELVKEEAKLRELELEARRVAVAEEQVKVQRLRAEADVAVKRQKAIVMSSEAVVEVAAEAVVARKELGEGQRAGLEPGGPGAAAGDDKWMRVFGEVMGILNRGGDPVEKLLEARGRLSEEMKLLEAGAA